MDVSKDHLRSIHLLARHSSGPSLSRRRVAESQRGTARTRTAAVRPKGVCAGEGSEWRVSLSHIGRHYAYARKKGKDNNFSDVWVGGLVNTVPTSDGFYNVDSLQPTFRSS